jgi:hypothetical protein
MSAMPKRLPRRSPAPETAPKPALRLVTPPPRRAGRVAFVLTLASLLVGGLTAVLALNIAMAEDAFEKYVLTQELADLSEQRAMIVESLNQHLAPASLAEAARQEGMVPAVNIAYVRLADGTQIGQAVPAGTDPEDDGAPTGGEEPSAEVEGEQ